MAIAKLAGDQIDAIGIHMCRAAAAGRSASYLRECRRRQRRSCEQGAKCN